MRAAQPDPVASAFAGPSGVRAARAFAVERAELLGRSDLADDVALVVTELVTNALLHGGGCTGVEVEPGGAGLRIAVRDGSRALPMVGVAADGAMTGRGMALVRNLVSGWGVTSLPDGKAVWAEVSGEISGVDLDDDDLLELWGEDEPARPSETRYGVSLGPVPTGLLLAAKAHVDNLVREFTLLAVGAGDGSTRPVPPHLEHLLSTITERFADARLSIKEQALRAAHEGRTHTPLVLELTVEAAAAGHDYLHALDQLDAYCRAARLVTLETEPEHRHFRHWYVSEIIAQVRAASAGAPRPLPRPFEPLAGRDDPEG